jgi:hypothetical protein
MYHGFEDGSSVTSFTTVSALFKGMFNERPPTQRIPPSWNLTVRYLHVTLYGHGRAQTSVRQDRLPPGRS